VGRIASSVLIVGAAFLLGADVYAQQPASPPPLPNRVNEALPSWLRVRGEFRERMEGFENAGFTSTRDDLYWLSRLRLNASVTASPLLSFQVQAQDARVGKKTVGPTGTPFSAPFDLRQGYADVGSARTPVAVRLGRQELAYGEQRLVGHVSWTNAARTFDGAKVTFRTPAFQVTRSARRSSGSSTASSTRAATATASPARMRRRRG
jgi:hypothetical protein